ncbi:ABC transporter permease [Lacrimispora saccharolytica]|uniref:Inner-membrane translocator n=1 Tax=Lacrimispora saccharolytica (strain ATCC 35040 / DSM 2544 / NRCC 2533 / WM1) TaxID=610130 RepID=D9R031_LACSW|nr:ribose ABC transporter permease [Lacrimispora saccharolytica]ADL04482.1 inner-membrane translocator [[Clostridium] saccharolyticum WM1]QRV21258.1 ribose ABC transporter permease [Lacrimispora saccharolytica]
MNQETKKRLINQINIYRSVLILLVICMFAAFLSKSFLSVSNLFNVFKQVTVAGIIGCGMTFVILTGGIDLSVGSILGFAGVVASGVLASTGNTLLAVFTAVAIGITCGIVNGFFISQCGIPPFIATLGMMTLLRGCVLVYTKGSPIPVKIDSYKFIGKGTVLGIPVPVIILIALFLLAHYILTQTSFGRSIYAFGGNREAARLSGISVKKTEWMAYIINGFLSGIAAVVLTARLGSAQSTSGQGIEMDAIAAVILGGTSLSGGTGFVLPTVVGAMIMGIIDNILTLMNVNPHATNIVKGAVVLIAVLVDKKVKDLSAKAE